MLRLRLARGVGFAEYEARWGRDARKDYAGELAQLSKLRLIDVTGERFTLSDGGLAVADAVAGEFLQV